MRISLTAVTLSTVNFIGLFVLTAWVKDRNWDHPKSPYLVHALGLLVLFGWLAYAFLTLNPLG